jgi:signal transduction histidine kinase
MNRGSIRFRLWSAAAISVLVALAIAGVGLVFLFEHHAERQLETDLIVDLNQVVGAAHFDGETLTATAPGVTDPRFSLPLSGYYWQVTDLQSRTLARSRSLWDAVIDLPPANPDGRRHFYEVTGPDQTLLLVLDRAVTDTDGRRFRVAVAQDHGLISQSVQAYLHELTPALLFLALVLSAAFFAQITVGLAPLKALGAAVSDVVAGKRGRLDAAAPAEVQPLTAEINRLLEAQEKALVRARARAADLAHGLKTPLQVISADIRLLRDRGDGDLADQIEKSTEAIRRHLERELARARVASPAGSVSADVESVARRVVEVVRRTPHAERIAFAIEMPAGLSASIDEGDLTELLGNLIENAARFAKARVQISAERRPAGTAITVADDGPGIPEADRDAVLRRGVSLGAARVTHGDGTRASVRDTGLGLAIVADIVESYRGELVLGDAKPGLVVTVVLPTFVAEA